MILAATGHRPTKLTLSSGLYPYGRALQDTLREFAMERLDALDPDEVISGMALGWDQAIARAALSLRIKVRAYVPFKGQESRWPEESQELYRCILTHPLCSTRIICEGEYAAWKMQTRNEAMVNDSTVLLALWDGSKGGTGNCILYANRVGREIVNVWDEWVNYLG